MSDIQNKAIIDLFLELVAIDSPSGHEERVRIFILNYLEKKGVKSCVDARGNIVAYISEEYKERAILFASHIDTVPNAINVKPIVTDEYICTDETSALGADNKAAVASMLYAIDTLQEMKGEIDPVVYLFSVSEETGLDGVKELDDKTKKRLTKFTRRFFYPKLRLILRANAFRRRVPVRVSNLIEFCVYQLT